MTECGGGGEKRKRMRGGQPALAGCLPHSFSQSLAPSPARSPLLSPRLSPYLSLEDIFVGTGFTFRDQSLFVADL